MARMSIYGDINCPVCEEKIPGVALYHVSVTEQDLLREISPDKLWRRGDCRRCGALFVVGLPFYEAVPQDGG